MQFITEIPCIIVMAYKKSDWHTIHIGGRQIFMSLVQTPWSCLMLLLCVVYAETSKYRFVCYVLPTIDCPVCQEIRLVSRSGFVLG